MTHLSQQLVILGFDARRPGGQFAVALTDGWCAAGADRPYEYFYDGVRKSYMY